MVQISKEQAKLVRKAFPGIHIHRTVHKFYVEENGRLMQYLKKIEEESKGA